MGMSLVLARSGEVLGRRDFSGDRVQIGRDPGSDFRIDHPTLSRQHALVEKQGGAYTIRDLGSANGTLLNGRPISGAAALNERDEIQLGEFTLTFHAAAPTVGAVPLVQDEAAYAVHGRTLDVKPGGENEQKERSAAVHAHLVDAAGARTYALERDVLLMGRGSGCQIRVGALLGPRIAAAIVRGHGGWALVRLGWRRVSVNGAKVVDRAWLADGDALTVAGRSFAFKLGLPR
jgi:hypothetical protein